MDWTDIMTFFREGTKSTYAAGEESLIGERGLKFWEYRSNRGPLSGLLYRDEYRSRVSGQYDRVVGARTIFLLSLPIWIMSYEGYYQIDNPELIILHKKALLEGAEEENFSLTGGRGPGVVTNGGPIEGLRYMNSVSFSKEHRAPRSGDKRGFLDYHGYEEISQGLEHIALLRFDYSAMALVDFLP